MSILLCILGNSINILCNFVFAYRLQKPDMGNVGGCRLFRKRLLTLFLGFFEIWKISIGVKDDAAVDVLGYVFNHGLALVPINVRFEMHNRHNDLQSKLKFVQNVKPNVLATAKWCNHLCCACSAGILCTFGALIGCYIKI